MQIERGSHALVALPNEGQLWALGGGQPNRQLDRCGGVPTPQSCLCMSLPFSCRAHCADVAGYLCIFTGRQGVDQGTVPLERAPEGAPLAVTSS